VLPTRCVHNLDRSQVLILLSRSLAARLEGIGGLPQMTHSNGWRRMVGLRVAGCEWNEGNTREGVIAYLGTCCRGPRELLCAQRTISSCFSVALGRPRINQRISIHPNRLGSHGLPITKYRSTANDELSAALLVSHSSPFGPHR
jgi:hypothetical protein